MLVVQRMKSQVQQIQFNLLKLFQEKKNKNKNKHKGIYCQVKFACKQEGFFNSIKHRKIMLECIYNCYQLHEKVHIHERTILTEMNFFRKGFFAVF